MQLREARSYQKPPGWAAAGMAPPRSWQLDCQAVRRSPLEPLGSGTLEKQVQTTGYLRLETLKTTWENHSFQVLKFKWAPGSGGPGKETSACEGIRGREAREDREAAWGHLASPCRRLLGHWPGGERRGPG